MEKIIKLLNDQEGVTAIEYAMIAFIMALAIIVVVGLLGQQVSALFQSVVNAVGAGS